MHPPRRHVILKISQQTPIQPPPPPPATPTDGPPRFTLLHLPLAPRPPLHVLLVSGLCYGWGNHSVRDCLVILSVVVLEFLA